MNVSQLKFFRNVGKNLAYVPSDAKTHTHTMNNNVETTMGKPEKHRIEENQAPHYTPD